VQGSIRKLLLKDMLENGLLLGGENSLDERLKHT
jgi:hypothetical protein